MSSAARQFLEENNAMFLTLTLHVAPVCYKSQCLYKGRGGKVPNQPAATECVHLGWSWSFPGSRDTMGWTSVSEERTSPSIWSQSAAGGWGLRGWGSSRIEQLCQIVHWCWPGTLQGRVCSLVNHFCWVHTITQITFILWPVDKNKELGCFRGIYHPTKPWWPF